MVSDKIKNIMYLTGVTQSNLPQNFGTRVNVNKKLSSNNPSLSFVVNLLDQCGAALVIRYKGKDGTQLETPILVSDVEALTLGKRRVGNMDAARAARAERLEEKRTAGKEKEDNKKAWPIG